MSTFSRRILQARIDTLRKYYKNPKFALIDLTFGVIGLFVNPYRKCRKFLENRGEENIYVYGETPYTTYEKIVKECGVGPNDVWLELGSGRGKGCFWLKIFVGCRVIGVEWVDQFVFFAKLIQYLFKVKGIRFERKDFEEADLSSATVIYLYGLYPNLQVKPGVKLITTGEPLEGYRVVKSFWVRFPWGRTTAYIQESQ